MNRTTTTIRDYPWGTLRTVRLGNRYCCILHPGHAVDLAALEPGGKVAFKDEQGIRWCATRLADDNDNILLAAGHRRLTVARNELELDR